MQVDVDVDVTGGFGVVGDVGADGAGGTDWDSGGTDRDSGGICITTGAGAVVGVGGSESGWSSAAQVSIQASSDLASLATVPVTSPQVHVITSAAVIQDDEDDDDIIEII